MKEFSTRSRDGCRKVNKGDMTCYVCGDPKGMKKEECMYASNDPKNKAVAYHEVAEYSSPTASVLPAPLHATLLGQPDDSPFSIEFSDEVDQQGESSTLSAAASSVVQTSTPATGAPTDNSSSKKKGSASTSSVVTVKSPSSANKAKKVTNVTSRSSKISNIKDNDKDKKKSVNSVKSTRVTHSSTLIVHERSKRSLDVDTVNKGKPVADEKNYDFDY